MIVYRTQRGYMDMQVMPAMLGVVLLIIILGMLNSPEVRIADRLPVFYGGLLLSTGFLAFGFGMHLMALGYPESPFNRHSSPVFMILVCGGALLYAGYRFQAAGMSILAVLYGLLFLLSIALSLACSVYRKTRGPE